MFMATDPDRFPNLIFTRVARPRHSTVRVSRGRNAPCAVRMSKRRSVKSLVKAAIAGVRASGIEVARVEVSQEGRVVVFAGKPGAVTAFDANPWDQVLDHAQDQEWLT
jgi:hypothetical protein